MDKQSQLDELTKDIQMCEYEHSMNSTDKVLAQWLLDRGYSKSAPLVALDNIKFDEYEIQNINGVEYVMKAKVEYLLSNLGTPVARIPSEEEILDVIYLENSKQKKYILIEQCESIAKAIRKLCEELNSK